MPTKLWRWATVAASVALGLGLSYFLYGEQLILLEIGTFRNRRLAAMPVIPLRDLARFADTRTLVRVKATMFVKPPITTGTQQALSFKEVRETHEEGRNHVVYVDDEYWTPDWFYVRDGATEVRVDVENKAVDHRFLPVVAKGIIRKGVLPSDVQEAIAPNFPKMHRHEGRTVTVYAIPEDAPVTVIGAVGLRDGRPVLLHPSERYLGVDVGRLIISPLPDGSLNEKLRTEAWIGIITNALVLVTCGATVLLLLMLGRREKRRAAGHQPAA